MNEYPIHVTYALAKANDEWKSLSNQVMFTCVVQVTKGEGKKTKKPAQYSRFIPYIEDISHGGLSMISQYYVVLQKLVNWNRISSTYYAGNVHR